MESRVGAHLVLIAGDRILLVRWAEGPVPQWTVPGGALELGELLDLALRIVPKLPAADEQPHDDLRRRVLALSEATVALEREIDDARKARGDNPRRRQFGVDRRIAAFPRDEDESEKRDSTGYRLPR